MMENNCSFQRQLAKQRENMRLITQSIEKSKLELSKIRNQWEATKMKCNEQNIELQNLRLKEMELTKMIRELRQREDSLKAECEKTRLEFEQIQYETKVANLKLENEKLNRQFYENVMVNYNGDIPNFLNVHEYFSTIKMEKEKEALKLQIATLKKSIGELLTTNSDIDQQDLLLHIQKHPSEKLKMLKTSLEKIEVIIQNKAEELRKLLN